VIVKKYSALAKPMEKEDDDDDNNEDDEDNEDDEEFFFAKMLKITKYTSLSNLVKLAQWEQVSEYYIHTYYY